MPAVDERSFPPVAPHCPTCAKEMSLTSVTPTSGGAIYGYHCEDDGDRLSWQPRQKNRPAVSRAELFDHAASGAAAYGG